MEIRRVVGKDEDAFHLRAYAFSSTPLPDEAIERFRAERDSDTVNLLAYDESGTALAVVGAIPLRQNVRGEVVSMSGVTGVASSPLARRQGNVRALMNRLHGDMRDQGCATSVLYPFLPSFYERFGYVGFPKARRIRLFSKGLRQPAALPGSVTLHRIGDREGFELGQAYLEDRLKTLHGFAIGARQRHEGVDRANDHWVVFAHDDAGAVIGMLQYRTKDFGGDFVGRDFLTSNELGRALLVDWFARHADQYAAFTFELPPDERPDSWATDIRYDDETRVEAPTMSAPMGRILSLQGLSGMQVGSAVASVEVVDDPFVEGRWTLDGTDPAGLEVRTAGPGEAGSDHVAGARLTPHGLAGLVFGTLSVSEVELRGYGTVDPGARAALATLFPRAWPYVYSSF